MKSGRRASKSGPAEYSPSAPYGLVQQATKNVLHDATVTVVSRLAAGIDAHARVEFLFTGTHTYGLHAVGLIQLRDSNNVKDFLARQAQRFCVLTVHVLKRQHTHAQQV